MHDHFSSYPTFENCSYAYCNAHHLRELQFITNQYHQAWARQMSQLLLAIKAGVTEVSQHASALTKGRIAHFESRCDGITQASVDTNPLHPALKRRGRMKQSPPENLPDGLDKHRAEVLALMYDANIPCDHNLAERDIRMVKVNQKISGSFRTEEGAKIIIVSVSEKERFY